MGATPAYRRAAMAGGATKGEARRKPRSSADTSSQYRSVYNAVSMAAQSIIGAVVSLQSCVMKGVHGQAIPADTHIIDLLHARLQHLVAVAGCEVVKWQQTTGGLPVSPHARCQMISLSWRRAWILWGLWTCAMPWQRSSLLICRPL